MVHFKRGDHIHFTNLKKYLIYNAVIINDVYIKKKGYFYEVIYQELPLIDKNKVEQNINFSRTWFIYKNIDNEEITVPFIKRGRKWLYLKNKLAENYYYYREVESLKKKYNFDI